MISMVHSWAQQKPGAVDVLRDSHKNRLGITETTVGCSAVFSNRKKHASVSLTVTVNAYI